MGDAGVKELVTLKNLEYLGLRDTQVSGTGAKELTALRQLRTLTLSGTKVTIEEVKDLRKSLPFCQIVH